MIPYARRQQLTRTSHFTRFRCILIVFFLSNPDIKDRIAVLPSAHFLTVIWGRGQYVERTTFEFCSSFASGSRHYVIIRCIPLVAV